MDFFTTSELFANGTIPSMYKGLIREKCPSDGYPIMRNQQLTYAHCMSPTCIEHLKHRLDELLKYLGHKGVGPRYCEAVLRECKCNTPFDAIEVIYRNSPKPKMYLWEVIKFCYIPGISNSARDLVSGYKNVADYIDNDPSPDPRIVRYRKLIERSEKAVSLKIPLSRNKLEVMITGSISGYKNRSMFIDELNSLIGTKLQIVLSGKKQKVDYLVAEDKDNILISAERGIMNSKTQAAMKGGVQIVTPQEFIGLICERLGI